MALKTWVMEESHFQTIASETVHGLNRHTNNTQSDQEKQHIMEQSTFFIGADTCQQQQQKQACHACSEQQCIWECHIFEQKTVPERWNMAKNFHLCFRCLEKRHHGKICRKTRKYGKNGCNKVHHRLLHFHRDTDRLTAFEANSHLNEQICDIELPQDQQGPGAMSSCYHTFCTEGKKYKVHCKKIAHTQFAGGQIENMDDACSSLAKRGIL